MWLIFFNLGLIYFFLQIHHSVKCEIISPDNLHSFVGYDAVFNYTTADGNKIYSAKFGIRKGNIPEPKFIYIDVRRSTPIINKDYRSKVAFVGNLTAGRAWFVLKNLTINDTNDYIAVIRDDSSGPNPYPMKLEVKFKDKVHFVPSTLKPIRTENTVVNKPTTLATTETNSTNDDKSTAFAIVTTITSLTLLSMILI